MFCLLLRVSAFQRCIGIPSNNKGKRDFILQRISLHYSSLSNQWYTITWVAMITVLCMSVKVWYIFFIFYIGFIQHLHTMMTVNSTSFVPYACSTPVNILMAEMVLHNKYLSCSHEELLNASSKVEGDIGVPKTTKLSETGRKLLYRGTFLHILLNEHCWGQRYLLIIITYIALSL